MFVDHLNLIQYWNNSISPWQKAAEKCGFCTGVKDGPTDGWMDGYTDPFM